MSTSTVSASVDTRTKAIANAYIRKAGLTPNEVIRNLWEYIARTGRVPKAEDAEREQRERRMKAFDELDRLAESMPRNTMLAAMSDEDVKEMIRDHGFSTFA